MLFITVTKGKPRKVKYEIKQEIIVVGCQLPTCRLCVQGGRSWDQGFSVQWNSIWTSLNMLGGEPLYSEVQVDVWRVHCVVTSNASWVMVTWHLVQWIDRQTHTTENITFPPICWHALIRNNCIKPRQTDGNGSWKTYVYHTVSLSFTDITSKMAIF